MSYQQNSSAQVLNTNGDYYLRKGMELEMKRDRLLESFRRSGNPKTLEMVKTLQEEAHKVWTTVRLLSFKQYM